eukprot:scaffold873_cov393-Prasinococcus_capsulatus_cf.AAC.1
MFTGERFPGIPERPINSVELASASVAVICRPGNGRKERTNLRRRRSGVPAPLRVAREGAPRGLKGAASRAGDAVARRELCLQGPSRGCIGDPPPPGVERCMTTRKMSKR